MKKAELLNVLQPFPKKVDLQVKIISEEDCGNYVRQRIQLFIEQGDIIHAFILIPKGISGKASVVYCHHQHASNYELGKSEVVGIKGDKDQAIGHELAEKGYIVFAPDAIAFEDRQNMKGGHYFELAKRIVRGENLLAKCIHDIQIGIDYLEGRNDTNIEDLGFIGHSYGGRMALIMPCLDDRIKVSVSNCGCVNYENSIDKNIGIQLDFCVPGIMNIGDIEDIIALGNSCNILITGTNQDKYSHGIDKIYDRVGKSFSEKDFEVKIYEGGHIFTPEMREYAYSFLNKYLK